MKTLDISDLLIDVNTLLEILRTEPEIILARGTILVARLTKVMDTAAEETPPLTQRIAGLHAGTT